MEILILTGGPVSKLESFKEPINRLGLNVFLASFYDLNFSSVGLGGGKKLSLKVGSRDLKEFSVIYFRVVGKRMEDATLVTNYAKENGIIIIDEVYLESLFIPSTISKGMEMKKLIDAGIPVPETIFAGLNSLKKVAPSELGYPFVLKSTSGRKARDAWLIDSIEKMDSLFAELRVRERSGVHFFAQKPIVATQRLRALVVGREVVGVITRPTKWRVALAGKNKEDGEKRAILDPDLKYVSLALSSAEAAGLDIAGIDILEEDGSGKLFVIEANAAPAWKLITKDCGVNVEEKVLKLLSQKAK